MNTLALADAALAQFHLRLDRARRLCAAGRWTAEEADARLFPWLAAALRCGADAARIHADLATELADRTASGLSETAARHLTALQFASDECVAAELASALAAARAAHSAHTSALQMMADRLGAIALETRKDAA